MTIRFAVVGLLALGVLAGQAIGQEPPAPGPEPDVMTMDEAIAIAVSNNPALAIAGERVEQARNQVREARSQARFKVDVSANRTYVTPVPEFTIDTPEGPRRVEVRTPEETRANATVVQPIDLTRRLSIGKQLANLQLDIREFGEAQTLQQLIADVKGAYYNVLRAQGAVDVAQAALDVAEERLRLARAQFEAGVVARFDVTQAEVDVANFQQTLIQARSNVDIAKGDLNRTLGIDVNSPVVVQEQEAAVEPVTVDIPERTEQALRARPEMQQARLAVDLTGRNVDFVSKENDPQVGLFAGADWTANTSAFNPNATTYSYGANVTWPIWNGGITKARVAQARNDLNIARQDLERATLGVQLDVRTAALNVMESSRRVETAQANVEQARESLRLANVRYQSGVSTALEVINAESALTQALTNAVNARYDYLNAVAQLQRATASQPEYERLTSPAIAALSLNGGNK
ncbi:MAG: TolC family protein [Armatimonadetes bacterium]|nr:TolC family protein [Armatimonadota bacterium]